MNDNIDEISYNIASIDNDFSSIELNRRRSNSCNSFFDENNNLKLNNLENTLKLNNISKKIDKLTNKTDLYIKSIKNIENNNYKFIIGIFGGIIIISFLSIKKK